MDSTTTDVGGLAYLNRVTTLLQQARLADPTEGLWDAAELQWAWRKDLHTDPRRARFWVDADGFDCGAVVITDWGTRTSFDIVAIPSTDRNTAEAMWAHASSEVDRIGMRQPIETTVAAGDRSSIERLILAGFSADPVTATTCWMAAADAPGVSDLASGYRSTSRAETPLGRHHMVGRSGEHVEERLRECSLYDPMLDLFVETDDGTVAAYGLFWADPVTGVGLVEPMRTEDAHQGRGLARHILTTGMSRLVEMGCDRLKITFMDDNAVSGHLYVSAGFEPTSPSIMFGRHALGPTR